MPTSGNVSERRIWHRRIEIMLAVRRSSMGPFGASSRRLPGLSTRLGCASS